MKKTNRITFVSTFLFLAYLLSACSGVPAGVDNSSNNSQSQAGQASEVAFTGTIDAMGGNQWTISGQVITVDGATSVDANVVVGDNVKVEARVGQDGIITAVRIEHAGSDNANANANDGNQNSNTNDNGANSNDDSNSNSNGNGNDNSSAGASQEVSGVVEAITTDSITIDGVVYMIADFTEFKDLVGLGDTVKVHVIVNADGTVTIREIEKAQGTGLENNNGSDDNSNNNSNSNDDDNNGNSNDDNTNDDHGNDNGGGNNNDSSGNGNGNGNG